MEDELAVVEKRLEELEQDLDSNDAMAVIHPLHSLLLAFSRESGKSMELDNLVQEVSDTYGVTEISSEKMKELILRSKKMISAKGEA